MAAGIQAEDAVVWPVGKQWGSGKGRDKCENNSKRKFCPNKDTVTRIAAFARLPEICRDQDNRQHRVPFIELRYLAKHFAYITQLVLALSTIIPLFIDKDPKLREIT